MRCERLDEDGREVVEALGVRGLKGLVVDAVHLERADEVEVWVDEAGGCPLDAALDDFA